METHAPLQLRFGQFELDEANARLARDGVPLAVPPKAFELLCALLRQQGRLVSKEQLLHTVWGHRFVSDSALKTAISELRGVLQDDARAPRYVETAARRGYRFIATLESTEAPAPPTMLDDGIVGREPELEKLQALWRLAESGQRQVCWIAGEAGIGKTTLIDRFVATLGPVACAHGQCIEQFGAAEPYLPVLDALAALCRADAALLPLLRSVAPTWLLHLPWLTSAEEQERLRAGLAAASQERMLREFAELVERFTAQRPLLLVTEDLHWCDGATVRLLDHLARRRAPARLLWIGSFRLAELAAANHPLHGLRHELNAGKLAQDVLLAPFSEAELARYLARRGAPAPEALVQRIHSQTDGLPLFVANLVEDLEAQGGQAPWRVPESLAGVIGRQILRLPLEDQRLLEAAAVCGVQFGVALLAQVLERAPAVVAARLAALVRGQHWLAPLALAALADGSLDMEHTFRHALYRELFYQRLPAMERAALHRRVAQVLEQRRAAGAPVSAAELAMHCERGLDVPRALRAYAAAVENALGLFAPSEAQQLARHALELLPQMPEGPQRQELEFSLLQPLARTV